MIANSLTTVIYYFIEIPAYQNVKKKKKNPPLPLFLYSSDMSSVKETSPKQFIS